MTSDTKPKSAAKASPRDRPKPSPRPRPTPRPPGKEALQENKEAKEIMKQMKLIEYWLFFRFPKFQENSAKFSTRFTPTM